MQESSGLKIVLAILVALLFASGSYVVTNNLNKNNEEIEQKVNCDEQENISKEECIELEIPVIENCTVMEILSDGICRPIFAPQNLTYGSDNFTWTVGEMYNLTPSFSGDGPDSWSVSPTFPSYIILNKNTGEITASPTDNVLSATYTIMASNNGGIDTIDLIISVIDTPPEFNYPSQDWIFIMSNYGESPLPIVEEMNVESWSVDSVLPSGLILGPDGRISGSPSVLGISYHNISAINSGGLMSVQIKITIVDEAPSLWYGAIGNGGLILTKDIAMSTLVASSSKGAIIQCHSQPELPNGLILADNCDISGTPTILLEQSNFLIISNNSGGVHQRNLSITIFDQSPTNIFYGSGDYTFAKQVDQITLIPTYQGGEPLVWSISPSLPNGVLFNTSSGEISGMAEQSSPTISYFIQANNSGGVASTFLTLTFIDITPSQISYEKDIIIAESNISDIQINVSNLGYAIDSWASHPTLPPGLILTEDGTISGMPNSRAKRNTYTIYANNSGGSFEVLLNITIHDFAVDWAEITEGVSSVDYGGSWPSQILPFSEWSFPILSDWDQRPVASAAYSGEGRIVGYGHESFVAKSSGPEMILSLNAMKWACDGVGTIGLWQDFNHFEDELTAEGFTVLTSVTPDQLSGLDCFVGEFWNGWSDSQNTKIEEFLTSGHGLILGGHSWYWSYSNTDLAHQYSGNKIAQTTGLFVSSNSGSAQITLDSTATDRMLRTIPAVKALEKHFTTGPMIATSDAPKVEKTISQCSAMLTLDFEDFWSPLREMVNTTGWTQISDNKEYDLEANPIDDVLLAIEEGLYLRLPADELIAHPSAVDFPGSVPANAPRVTQNVSINGDYIGLPSGFGYSGARAHGLMGTGLYAAPGEAVNITVPPSLVDQNVRIQIGAHSDSLWNKDKLDRHPKIHRIWIIDSEIMQVGNTFGGLIYLTFPPDSTFGMLNVEIENAVQAPRFIAGVTTGQEWNNTQRNLPAPWAELEGDFFILTVPSAEIRNLNNTIDLMNWWDTALQMEHELSGYLPWTRIERAVFDIQISAGWMHSGYPFMAHTASVNGVVNLSHMSTQGDWGMFHELGHNHQWMAATLPGNTETTCNLFSAYIMTELVGVDLGAGHGAMSNSNRESRTETYFNNGAQIAQWSVWTALETHIMIQEEFGWDVFTTTFQQYYNTSLGQPSTDYQEYNSWAARISNQTGMNLIPFFRAWGLEINDETFDLINHLPVWNTDPLREWVHDYPSLLKNLSTSQITSSSATLNWENYDNGSNVNQTICWGLVDGGTTKSAWSSCSSEGLASVGQEDKAITGLTTSSTYYWRVLGEGASGDHWSDVQTFSTI